MSIRSRQMLYHFMSVRLTLLFVALTISTYAASGEWTFSGSNEAVTIQSVSSFINDENGISHIPRYVIIAKIDAFKCGNPYLKLCVKQESDILNYPCLGPTLDGLNRKEIELKGSNIPEFNCSEKVWYNKGLWRE